MSLAAEIHQSFMDSVLRPYQREWINQILSSRFCFMLGSRQIGKSFTISYAAILLAAGAAGKASDVLILSKDLRASRDVIRDVKLHLEAWAKLGLDLRHSTKGSDSRIVLSNGCHIEAMPGRSKSIQGHTGTVIIDELEATEADPEESLAQASFVSSSDESFKVIIITNAGSKDSFTDNLFNSKDSKWEQRRERFAISNTTIYDAYPEGLPNHIKDLRNIVSDAFWQQFYLNLPSHGAETLVSAKQLEACINNDKVNPTYQTIISIDPGWTTNPAGIVVAKIGGGTCKVIHADHLYKWSQNEQIDLIKHLMVEHRASKLVIDQGTQAWQMARTLEAMYPTMTISRSTNNATRAREAATLQRLIREEKLSIPNYDELKEDILSIALDDKKNIIIPERPTSDKGTGIKHKIHGDCADALLYCMEFVVDTWDRSTSKPSSAKRMGSFKTINQRIW
jgi:hypothetical protein